MSDLRAELRAAAEAASSGPWQGDGDEVWRPSAIYEFQIATTELKRDAAFIALANPTAVLGLLDDLAAAEQRAEMWRDVAERAKARIRKSPQQIATEEADALRRQLGCDCGGVIVHRNCASRQYVITKREFDDAKRRADAAEAAVERCRTEWENGNIATDVWDRIDPDAALEETP